MKNAYKIHIQIEDNVCSGDDGVEYEVWGTVDIHIFGEESTITNSHCITKSFDGSDLYYGEYKEDILSQIDQLSNDEKNELIYEFLRLTARKGFKGDE
ncbi:unnamed protein product [Commensalibacter communis]|uniref:hypothetical protein n=1 Tax=Commensalibacter communis TaxID=2972786 RepID=UPI0022FF9A25|nr:hypothetical protein [Commensalibacter communis]CAI3953494.1 unnamed protein product [Commensalibacter communis]CAI3959275.1 unnamed protein product [Commensalibacter communis]